MLRFSKRPLAVISFIVSFLIFFGASAAGVRAATAAADAAPLDPGVIGVVDYVYLMNRDPEIVEANQAFQAESDRLDREFSLQSAGLTYAEIQRSSQQLQQQLAQKRQELLAPMRAKINAAVQMVARVEGLVIVLPKSALVDGGRDITNDVFLELTKP